MFSFTRVNFLKWIAKNDLRDKNRFILNFIDFDPESFSFYFLRNVLWSTSWGPEKIAEKKKTVLSIL